MVTIAQAQTFRNFTHATIKNADGSPLRARANGKVQTWVTRPGQFRLPIKVGFRGYGQITHNNRHNWHVEGMEAFTLEQCAVATDKAIEGGA